MHFTGTIWRPPYEATSALLQVTVGCTHNRCRFCALYDEPFRLSPLQEIEDDLRELRHFNLHAERVWLTGANPFGVGGARLEPILQRIRRTLPRVRTIGGFVRIGDLRHKSDAELERWARLGVDGLTIGVESGHDPSLAFMDKGHTAADIVEQCRRLDAAGIGYYFFYLSGMAGAGRCVEAARESASTFNKTNPRLVAVLSMTLFPNARLARDVETGRFTSASEGERLDELAALVSGIRFRTFVDARSVSNAAPVAGMIPYDRGHLLAEIEHVRNGSTEAALTARRRGIREL